ncbi:branched-chain amino acid ABC transporter permease [Loigolactobacillus backii]|uniref:AzlC family ABC transporter permease n=1 Tax=Loigolactobacillus backii TaxID=375175 RepID=UPI0007F06DD9|nr:AzlC family ABC transporter permease [Loigolactobacillus backii]ANK64611.1 branched-chain amino acid ABC transporter permease [Loigolactobacillus backii]
MNEVDEENQGWLAVFKIALPLCLSYIPIGLACGILLHSSGFNILLTGLVSILAFSGGAQFLIASMLAIHAPLLQVLLMLLFLELRYALLSASLSPFMKKESLGFLVYFASSMNDENYAINYLKFATDKNWNGHKAVMVNHYSMLFWTVSNMIGSTIGNLIHFDVNIVNFTLTALFGYMMVMQVKNWLSIGVAALSGMLSVWLMIVLKSTMGLVIATLIASFVGFLIEHSLEGHKHAFLLRGLHLHRRKGQFTDVKETSDNHED